MEEENSEDYIEMNLVAHTIASIKREKSPNLDHGEASPDTKAENEGIYQLPKVNPTPLPHSQDINKPLVPPKIIKRRNLRKPVTEQSEQPDTSLQKPTDAPVNETGSDNNEELTQSNKLNTATDSFDGDQQEFTEQQDKPEQEDIVDRTVKTKPIPLPRLSEKSLDPLMSPDKADAPVNQQSPTLPLDKDEATHNPPPVDETVQSPTDVATESTQNSNPNKPIESSVANHPNDGERFMQAENAKHQKGGGYQTLKLHLPLSPGHYEKPVDPLLPPRNIMRPPKTPASPKTPTSPANKDKIQDKIMSVTDKAKTLPIPPRQRNPYVIDHGYSQRNGGSLPSTEEGPPERHQQRKESTSTTQEENSSQESEEKPDGQSYTLADFVETYQLPQLVTVTEGHYGTSDDFSMSEGMEIILFFKKKTQAVIATAQHTEETFYIPLNCLLQFSPYRRDSREHLTKSYYYKTVNHLLNRKEGLPKVVRILKSHKTTPVLNANELIFPKGLSSQGTHLKCTDLKKEEIRLKLSCDIGFSTNPSDTKMHLADYIEHINEFPSSVMVFCDYETKGSIFDIHTGMEMVLQECKMLYSCICSTDVHGRMNYPLMELLTALPIEIKAISSPTVGLEPIYDTVKKVYETFKISMVQTSMFLAQDDRHNYEEIRRFDNYQTFVRPTNFYNLELPTVAYTKLPPRKKIPGEKIIQDTLKPGGSPTSAGPPLPPRQRPSPTISRTLQDKKPQFSKDQDAVTNAYTTLADERRFYLRSFKVTDVLKLLDKMKLDQFKGVFKQKDVDGKVLLSFTKYELEDMGITDGISQKQLLDVISGHTTYRV